MIKNLLTRFYTSIIILALFMLIFFSSFYPVIFEVLIGIISAVCIYEAINATGFEEKKRYMIPSMIYGLLIPLTYSIKELFFKTKSAYYAIIIITFVYLMLSFVLLMVKFDGFKFSNATSVMFTSVVISCFLTNIIFIRRFNEHGFFYMILVIVCGAWVTDIFAYLTGMLIGKHKLSPHVSPKKTIEGSLGGALFSILFSLLFCYIYSNITGAKFNWLLVIVYALIYTLVGQLGDLSFSYIKRSYGIKDFGKILPGHGGFLDRLDSLIFIAPVFYMLINICDIIY